MRTPLALLNLAHDPRRFAVAVTGVAFATTLILMQLGFFGAVRRGAVLVYDRMPFDLLLRSPTYAVFVAPGDFPDTRLRIAAAVAGVERVVPMWVGLTPWQRIEPAGSTRPESDWGLRRPMLVLGIDPENPSLSLPEVRTHAAELRRPGNVLIDRRSHAGFGETSVGTVTEAGRSRVEVVGRFTMGTGFSADGAIVVGEETFGRIAAGAQRGAVNFGLVRLEPGADAAAVAARLRDALPADVQVLTRAAALGGEQRHWIRDESLGVVFTMGLLVSVVVGLAVVYQLLSAEITDRFAEYATLKAMGYRPTFLSGVILQQAALLAVAAFPPALGAAATLDWLAHRYTSVPVAMDPGRVGSAFVLTLAMCVGSGLLSIRKVQTADPAELF